MTAQTPFRRLLAPSGPARLAGSVVIVGLGAGVGAVVFRYLIFGVTYLATGQQDYAATPGAPWTWWPGAGTWFLLAVPVIGGLLYGPMVFRWAREARGHGVPEVMLAVAQNEGRIRPRVAVVKSLASALCIGTGGSVGREGPIVQIGSAIGSSLGRWLRMPTFRLQLLVACGAAGGISATFNAPVAGVFFALEIILADFTLLSFLVVTASSAIANTVARAVDGSQTFLVLPPFHVASAWEYLLYALVGVVGGLIGVAFTRVLYGAEDVADRFWRGPEWLRPAVGGVLLGLLLLVLPQMYGVGYPVLKAGVAGAYALGFLLILLVGKLVATSLTLAIGGSGGIFAPSLFLGAMAGTALGDVFGLVGAGGVGQAGAYGLVGMAAVLAGATRAPITAVVIVAEITGEWNLTIPLMIAVVIGTAISLALSRETIYTMKLVRRGIRLYPPGTPQWARRTAADAVGEPDGTTSPGLDGTARTLGPVRWSPVVDAERPLSDAADDLALRGGPDAGGPSAGLPVVSTDGRRLLGVLRPGHLVAGVVTPGEERSGDDAGRGEQDRCVVELPHAPGERWSPPDGFTVLDGSDRLLVGPRAALDDLVAGWQRAEGSS